MIELLGDAPDRRVELLCEHERVHVTWTRFGPLRMGADPHVHYEHADFFYVLEGELTVILADGELTVPAGKLVRVPPRVVHGFRNAADTELRYLNLHVPGMGFADYMRGLRDGRKVPFDQYPPPDEGTVPPPKLIVDPEDVDELTLRVVSGPPWLYVSL
jgi:mannose-6-phosphate isomerase-like protein (cupin superfamily)